MMRALKYLMRVIYAKNRYSKYGDKGETFSYLQAIIGASFFTLMIIFMLFLITAYISPDFNNWCLTFSTKMDARVDKKFSLCLWLLISCLFAALIGRKKDIVNNMLTKEEANKAAKYFLVCFLISLIIIAALFTKKYHQ